MCVCVCVCHFPGPAQLYSGYTVRSGNGQHHNMFYTTVLIVCDAFEHTVMYVYVNSHVRSVESWQSFLGTSVVDKLRALVLQGNFSSAAYIWTTSLVRVCMCVASV